MLIKNHNQISLITHFKRNSLLAVITTAVLISAMISYLEFQSFSKYAQNIESEYISSKKSLIKQEVLRVTKYIQLKRAQSKENIRTRIKKRTYEAHAIATNIYNQFKGELSDKKIKKLIIESLRPLRFFNGKGYFFIHSLDGIVQLHGLRPKKEGQNRLNFKTSTGQYVLKDFASIINNSGEGFLHYKYPSGENLKIEKNKFTYVKLFKPYNWSIGTGDYLENIEQSIQKELLKYIAQIKFGENSYIFVVDYDGNILMNSSQRKLIGTNMSQLTDPNGINVFLEERKAVNNPNGGFIYYVWNKPSSSSPSPKITFMKGIPEWQWMIGTGLYVDDAKIIIALQRDTLKNELMIKIFYILIFTLMICIFIITISNRFTKLLTKDISIFLSLFSETFIKANKINLKLLRFTEFKELAVSANHMLDENIEAEKSLLTSEKNLSSAQRITHFGSWDLNIKNNLLHWSDEVYRIFGLSPSEYNPTYKSFRSFVHPDEKHHVDEQYHLSIKNKTPYNIEYRIILNNGKIKYVREHAETDYNDNGDMINSSGTIQDITELKEKEEQLRRTLKMDALGKLIGGIAHDYNNMMGVVLGYSELLLSQVVANEKAINYVVQIRKAGERARALTNKLLSFSSYKSSETEIININEELEQQHHLLEKTLTARITLNFKLHDDLWLTKIDPGDLNDAIINFSINVLHAIEKSGTMTISTDNVELDLERANTLDLATGEYVSVSIEDTGIGMSNETMSKIFDPFFTTKGDLGTGLGLSQIYGFIKRSGGSIAVTSTVAQGTKFILYFPRYLDDAANKDDVNPSNTSVVEKGSKTILIVDDEEPLCDLTSELLNNQGYQTIKSYSAQQALKILETEQVDIVFSDVIMPEMSGYELAEKISKKYPNIIVGLTSGFNHLKDLNENATIQDIDILNKPYTSDELFKKMNELSNMINKS